MSCDCTLLTVMRAVSRRQLCGIVIPDTGPVRVTSPGRGRCLTLPLGQARGLLVPVAKPIPANVTEYVDYTGRTNAQGSVTIQPRVIDDAVTPADEVA